MYRNSWREFAFWCIGIRVAYAEALWDLTQSSSPVGEEDCVSSEPKEGLRRRLALERFGLRSRRGSSLGYVHILFHLLNFRLQVIHIVNTKHLFFEYVFFLDNRDWECDEYHTSHTTYSSNNLTQKCWRNHVSIPETKPS